MHGQPSPYGSAPPPPVKKGPSGCLVAAIVMGVIGLIGVITGGIVAVKVFNLFTPAERAQLEAELRESAVAGQGPAADALRNDGCFGADVVDTAAMPALTKSLVDAGPGDKLTEKVIVDCTPPYHKTQGFTCARIAKTYLGAVGKAPGPFRVMVHESVGGPVLCSELRAADGAALP